MILRRITNHIKDQNWFAVALDFFIVVMGILIAFQITNWSESRSDKARERQIIERLYEDFEALGREVDANIESMKPAFKILEETKQLVIHDPNDADLQRIQDFYNTTIGFPSVAGQSVTYEQLVSSGDMNLISNEQLRSELAQHASFTQFFIDQDNATREWLRPYIMPFIRLRSLVDVMPLEEAFAEAGSKADLIVAFDMYQTVFEGQLSQHKAHKERFEKITKLLAEERNK
ncbi:MAG: hypothetical protein ACSHXY_10550 [Alphaproteobacteria bacterium]